MTNLLKALPRKTEADYKKILINLYSDEQTDRLISSTSGENVAGRINAIQYFLDNPDSFDGIRQAGIDGVEERAKKILEAIKGIKSNEQIGGAKGGEKGGLFLDILERFKSGDIESLSNWANSAETKQSKSRRVKEIIDNKTKLFDAIKNFDEAKQTQAYEMLKNTYKIDKPAPDTYTISARPNSQIMIAYLRNVVTSNNMPKRNKIQILPKKHNGGVTEMFGNDYNDLFPTLVYILENKNLPTDASGNLNSTDFQKKKTKMSIATQQALNGLRGSDSPEGLKRIMNTVIANTKADITNKKIYQDNKFLQQIAKDTSLKNQFEEYVRRLSASVSLYRIPKDDYLSLESEEESDTYNKYGFDDAQEFEDWLDESEEREAAFKAMVLRGEHYTMSSVNDLRHLSDLFTEEDIDIKQTFFEIQERDRKELGQYDKRFRMFKDLIPMIYGIGTELGTVDSDDKGFGLHYTKFKKAKDDETREEKYELILKELINKGMYAKIRNGFRQMIYDSMLELVEKNYRIGLDGVKEPISILIELGVAQKVVKTNE